MTKAATVQDALRKFSGYVASRWVFDEASVALDAGCDYKVTITCTQNPKGYVVAMHRHKTDRLGHNSFVKLAHGEWDAAGARADAPTQAEQDAGSKCQPDGLMFDAFGKPRTRAVRITLDGVHLICRPEEVDSMIEGDDRSRYTFSDVYVSDDEIERLPEFEGW